MHLTDKRIPSQQSQHSNSLPVTSTPTYSSYPLMPSCSSCPFLSSLYFRIHHWNSPRTYRSFLLWFLWLAKFQPSKNPTTAPSLALRPSSRMLMEKITLWPSLYFWDFSPQKCPMYKPSYYFSCSFVFGSQKYYFMLSSPFSICYLIAPQNSQLTILLHSLLWN